MAELTVSAADADDVEQLTEDEVLDPGRWVTLVIAIVAAFVVVLDNTVLNVSIPTIQRELNTTLPSLQWVITGYALTFAALLIIGGRLGDVYGHRRTFIAGLLLFGIGSLIASIAQSVGQLILGEAVIEGIGASMMLPATLAVLSGTFRGRERATAFAMWGATAGVAAALGPVVGGFLTTNYSWRWSFRINVIVAPLGIIGALVFMKHAARPERRLRVDIGGAALIAIGMFGMVFALSEGGVYGWWEPLKDFSVAGAGVWPTSRGVSIVPILLVLSLLVLAAFVRYELSRSRRGLDPLFEFGHLRLPTFRYGLLTVTALSMGQLGIALVLSVFLQDALHLSAERNGLWMLPSGAAVIVGAQLGARLIRKVGTVAVVRIGLGLYAVGTVLMFRAVTLGMTAWTLLPGLVAYGIGIGFAGAQLSNVILSEIPAESSGVASGANTTMRQVGSALGVSVIGSILVAKTASATIAHIKAAPLAAAVKVQAIGAVHDAGSAAGTPRGLSPQDASVIGRAVEHGVASGARAALIFAVVVISSSALLSFLIPDEQG